MQKSACCIASCQMVQCYNATRLQGYKATRIQGSAIHSLSLPCIPGWSVNATLDLLSMGTMIPRIVGAAGTKTTAKVQS